MNRIREFDAVIEDMKHESDDEWAISNYCEKIKAELLPHEVFHLIPIAVRKLLEEKDEFIRREILTILIYFSRISKTTQIPECISENIQALKSAFDISEPSNLYLLNEFLSWYRIHVEPNGMISGNITLNSQ